MPRDLTGAVITELDAPLVRPIIALEVETTAGFIRVWNGVGTILLQGNVFIGVGDFGSITEVKETEDLEATGVNFELSGISSAFIAAALAQFQHQFPATLLFAVLDATGAVIATPFILYEGLTDVPEINEAGETATISLSSESKLMELDRAFVRRYTSEDQQLDFPDDLGFDFVPGIQDKEVIFGF